MNILEIIQIQKEVESSIHEENVRHKNRMEKLDSQLKDILEQRQLYGLGFDLDKIALAETLLKIEGEAGKVVHGRDRENCGLVRSRAIENAIMDIVMNDGKEMFARYFGVKNYSSFGDQHFNGSYNSGPAHGTLVFSIGYTQETRNKRNPDFVTFTNTEKEAMAYYLQNLVRIQEARKKAELITKE